MSVDLIDNNGNLVDSPVHLAFELSYASFLVIPRLLMEAMPWGWQKDMVDLMEQLSEKYIWEIEDQRLVIRMTDQNGRFVTMDKNLCDYRRGDASWYEKGVGETV